MFTQPVSPPPPGPQTATQVSPSRSSRLRGLSYLRNYTHNHLLSRDSHHPSTSNGRSTSPREQQGQGANLTRSVSYTPPSTLPGASSSSNNPPSSNHLTLVSSSPDTSSARATARGENRSGSASPPAPILETDDSPSQSSAQNIDPEIASADPSAMTRQRAVATNGGETVTLTTVADSAVPSSSSNGTGNGTTGAETVPSIRFSAYYDPRSTRPSLSFPPITRTLPNATEIIRVGRYSERDGAQANTSSNQPSSAPVGFKSKVVSRRHCEFWCENGKWFIKDVKSSSGTFLNHIRLSPPSQESKAYPVNDGDIVQLGIDFKGGEEMIFRCVKMRLELNRGWQNKLNSFNVAAHKRLRTMATTNAAAGAAGSSSQDCSICLNSIAPCQSLFVAPCSHTWHFKCVRSLLTSPQYPIFVCPNCRAGADLEADVEEPTEEWQQLEEDQDMETDKKDESSDELPNAPAAEAADAADVTIPDGDAMDVTVSVNVADSPAARSASGASHTTTEPLPIRNPASGSGRVGHLRENRSTSPSSSGAEGPITPRNNAGPWVFDGSAGRRVVDGSQEMVSIDAAADMDVGEQTHSDDSSR